MDVRKGCADLAPFGPAGPVSPRNGDDALLKRYFAITQSPEILWAAQYRKLRLLGKGTGSIEDIGPDIFYPFHHRMP